MPTLHGLRFTIPQFDDGELEYCGVSIHFLDEGVDSGDIISQGRSAVDKSDTIHSLGDKIIKVGIKLICESIEVISDDSFSPLKQDLSIGKKYYRKDFNADFVIWMDTIKEGRFEDTNKMFEPPEQYDFKVTHLDAQMWAFLIKADINEKMEQ